MEGGAPPPPLRSQDLLPRIQLLLLLQEQHHGQPATAQLVRRWAQLVSVWRQLLRQWLLLEPLLRQMPAPLPAGQADPLLLNSLAALQAALQSEPDPSPGPGAADGAQRWLAEAEALGASRPLVLAVGQQTSSLRQLLRERTLLQGAIAKLAPATR